MSCRAFDDLILDYCENAVGPEERSRVEAHVAECAKCRAYLEIQREIANALPQAIGGPALSPAFRQRLMRRVESEREERLSRAAEILDVLGYVSVAVIGAVLIEALLPPTALVWVLAGASVGLAGWTSARLLRQG
jgi:anti-sigma factor RsiW